MRMEFNSEYFGKCIKTKRTIELDIDLRKLSDEINISPATLSRCENGGTPDLDVFATICNWLDIEMSSFFTFPKKRKLKKQ